MQCFSALSKWSLSCVLQVYLYYKRLQTQKYIFFIKYIYIYIYKEKTKQKLVVCMLKKKDVRGT